MSWGLGTWGRKRWGGGNPTPTPAKPTSATDSTDQPEEVPAEPAAPTPKPDLSGGFPDLDGGMNG